VEKEGPQSIPCDYSRDATISNILQLQEAILRHETQMGRKRLAGSPLKALLKQTIIYSVIGRRLSRALADLIKAVKDRKRPYLGPELANALEAASRKVMGYKRWLLMLGLMAALPGLISVALLWQQNLAVKEAKDNRIADLRNNKRVELLITIYHTTDKSEAGLLTTPVFSASNRRNAVIELIQWDADRLAELEEDDIFKLNRMVDLSVAPLNDVDFSPIPGEPPLFFKDIGFVNSNFEGASFEGCRFEHVWFSSAQLYGTNFRQARFKDVLFDEAIIAGADFSEAEFIMCDFEGAVYDQATRWPDGFDPRDFGAVLEE